MLTIGTLGDLSLKDPFFNSFKKDYPEFKQWFDKNKNRLAYYNLDDNGKLNVLLVLKLEFYSEPYSDMSIKFEPLIRLKVCSFKSKSHSAELLEELKSIIELTAISNEVDRIYITINPNTIDKRKLEKLLISWNYHYICICKNDKVYEKFSSDIN